MFASKTGSMLFQSYPKVFAGFGRVQARQIVSRLSPSCSKFISKLSGVWLFASMAVSKLFQYFPKLTTGFGCLQARQIVSRLFPSFPKLSQNCHGVWLFASNADCLKVVSKMFQSYPKAIRGFGCLQARQVVLRHTSHLTRVSTSLRRPPR